jgi:hypothetical protein
MIPHGNLKGSDMGKLIANVETVVNVVALTACWLAVAWLASWGHAHLAGLTWPDATSSAVADAAARPSETMRRAAGVCLGVCALGVAAALALSAAEGTWWISRRLSRARG